MKGRVAAVSLGAIQLAIAALLGYVVLETMGTSLASAVLWLGGLLVVHISARSGQGIVRRVRRISNPQVTFAPGGFAGNPFYAEVLHRVSALTRAKGYELVTQFPDHDFSRGWQHALMHKIAASTSDAIIFNPVYRDVDNELRDFLKGQCYRLIFFDHQETHESRQLLDEYGVSRVYSDPGRGGEIGARIAENEIRSRDWAPADTCVVVATADTESVRIASFLDEFRRLCPGIATLAPRHDSFSRQDARLRAKHYLADGRWWQFCVFCANDVMALGVRDAIEELRGRTEDALAPREVVVIGYDAIAEVRDLIDRGDRIIVNSVDVQITRVCDSLVSVCEAVIRGRTAPLVTVVEPRPYKHSI